MENLKQIEDFVKSFETMNIDFDDCDSFSDFKQEGIEELDVYLQEDFGISYEEGNSLLYIFVGDSLPIESIPNDWDEFAYYPTVSEEYQIITKLIISYSSFETSGINNENSGYFLQ
jgi:hypothetical protein